MRCPAAFAALLFACLTQSTNVGTAKSWPDNFVGRLEILALIEQLNGALLASPSATTTLESWCADHHLASSVRLIAIPDKNANVPASAADRLVLGVGPQEPVRYRRVALTCGSHVFSRAENWYVPSRLTPQMNRTLGTTDVPFGRVIRPLRPTRQTLSVERLWPPLPKNWDQIPPADAAPGPGIIGIPTDLFRHRAVVYDARHRPIALVVETYQDGILGL